MKRAGTVFHPQAGGGFPLRPGTVLARGGQVTTVHRLTVRSPCRDAGSTRPCPSPLLCDVQSALARAV